jgi:hypothetical protein
VRISHQFLHTFASLLTANDIDYVRIGFAQNLPDVIRDAFPICYTEDKHRLAGQLQKIGDHA